MQRLFILCAFCRSLLRGEEYSVVLMYSCTVCSLLQKAQYYCSFTFKFSRKTLYSAIGRIESNLRRKNSLKFPFHAILEANEQPPAREEGQDIERVDIGGD